MSSKNALENLRDGEYAHVALNKFNFKYDERFFVHKDGSGNTKSQLVGFRVYLNTKSRCSGRLSNDYKIKIQKKTEESITKYYICLETFNIFLKDFLWPIVKSRGGDDREVVKFKTTFKEITQINSKKKSKDYFTVPCLILPEPQSEEEQKLLKAIEESFTLLPRDDLLLSMTNFSSIPIDYSFKVDGKAISHGEAKEKIDKIFAESNLDENIIKLLKEAYNIEHFFDYNNKKSSFWDMLKPQNIIKDFKGMTSKEVFLDKSKSGAVLHGPPGTGKTYAVKNTIEVIYKEVFGYSIVPIEMSTLTEGGSYYGALANAVTEVFTKAIKVVQQTHRPCLIFVDEADRLIRHTERDDDNEGFAAHKNYINALHYPGIQLCYVTNIEDKDEMNSGLIERRLDPIFFGYPNIDVARKAWIKHIRTKLFPARNIDVIFLNDNGERVDNKDVYDSLAQLVAGNVGLDRIDDFCKTVSNGRDIHDPIYFNEFRIQFYIKTQSRIETLKNEKLNKIKGVRNQLVDTTAIDRINNMVKDQMDRLKSALKNESEVERGLNQDFIRESIMLNSNENMYYIEYKRFYWAYINLIEMQKQNGTSIENSEECIDLLYSIYTSSSFLFDKFKLGNLKFKPMQDQDNFYKALRGIFEISKDVSSRILAKKNRTDILMENPELAVENPQSILESEKDTFLGEYRQFIFDLKPTILFALKNIDDEPVVNRGKLEKLVRKNEKELLVHPVHRDYLPDVVLSKRRMFEQYLSFLRSFLVNLERPQKESIFHNFNQKHRFEILIEIFNGIKKGLADYDSMIKYRVEEDFYRNLFFSLDLIVNHIHVNFNTSKIDKINVGSYEVDFRQFLIDSLRILIGEFEKRLGS